MTREWANKVAKAIEENYGEKPKDRFLSSYEFVIAEGVSEDIFYDQLILQISHETAEFITTVFHWQKNINENTFYEYADYIYLIGNLIRYLKNYRDQLTQLY